MHPQVSRAPSAAAGTERGRISRKALLAGGLATALLLAACGSDDSGDAGSSDDGTTDISVGAIPIVDVAPLYLGVEKGFFDQQGLKLKIETAQGGAAIVPGVVSDQFQFGFSNTTSLLLAASKGLPLKVVTSGVATTGKDGADFGAVVVAEDSAVKTAADLASKRVAVNTLNNINTTTVNKAVRDAGGDPSGISYVELPFPDIPAAIAKGDVDAGQVVEPFLTVAQNQGMRQVASNYVATHPELTIAAYFTSANYAKANAETVTKFTTAMNESLAYADSHPDEARAILSTYTEIDPAVQEAVTLPKWPSQVSEESVNALSELAVQDKLITSAPDISQLLP
ncbi:ABC transporter substrate-binding protein [Kineosporia sp. NBRC 101677]|uniref:ABC transporter substrate-binding protein n=1 Tax=Kineosporia sp. NBRC 101677 TaxID=3032197 RepID=UPI0025558103|nr:ABC transporter substrate-binding protein [Kineosporia sp. NBRC 101677]